MNFAVSKSNQIVRIFYCGSGNKLNTVLIIFTEQLRVTIAQKVAGFKRKYISTNKYGANIKNVKGNLLPA
jgi:hypothetical protein